MGENHILENRGIKIPATGDKAQQTERRLEELKSDAFVALGPRQRL